MTDHDDFEIKPCPCCGSYARLSTEWQDCDGNPAIECSSCNLLSWITQDWNRRILATRPADVRAIEAVFLDMRKWEEEMPRPDEWKMKEWTRKLAAAIGEKA